MGMFQVKVKVANPKDSSRAFEELFWVDTGATYSFLPAAKLGSIGIWPDGMRDIVFTAGQRERCGLGDASLTIEGIKETRVCPMIFAPAGSLNLLGATALESFGVAADPDTRTLKPIAAIIGGFIASR